MKAERTIDRIVLGDVASLQRAARDIGRDIGELDPELLRLFRRHLGDRSAASQVDQYGLGYREALADLLAAFEETLREQGEPCGKGVPVETTDQSGARHVSSPKYFVDIDGTEYPWDAPEITTEQIATLGGFDPSQGVIVVDADGNERNLGAGEVIELKPGHRFGKRPRFRRGGR
jgi:hypothetical protein